MSLWTVPEACDCRRLDHRRCGPMACSMARERGECSSCADHRAPLDGDFFASTSRQTDVTLRWIRTPFILCCSAASTTTSCIAGRSLYSCVGGDSHLSSADLEVKSRSGKLVGGAGFGPGCSGRCCLPLFPPTTVKIVLEAFGFSAIKLQ